VKRKVGCKDWHTIGAAGLRTVFYYRIRHLGIVFHFVDVTSPLLLLL
jgi:hypothetical protein